MAAERLARLTADYIEAALPGAITADTLRSAHGDDVVGSHSLEALVASATRRRQNWHAPQRL